MVSVRVGEGRVGGLAGRRVRVRSPEESGRGTDVGVGRWSALQLGISMRVVMVRMMIRTLESVENGLMYAADSQSHRHDLD